MAHLYSVLIHETKWHIQFSSDAFFSEIFAYHSALYVIEKEYNINLSTSMTKREVSLYNFFI